MKKLKPPHILALISLCMGVTAANNSLEIPFMGAAATLLAIGVTYYSIMLALKDKSKFLKKEYQSESNSVRQVADETEKENAYQLYYCVAFVLWIPTVWFIWLMIFEGISLIV